MTTQPYPRDPFRANASDQAAEADEWTADPSAVDEETKPVTAVKPTPFARVAARLAEVSPGQADKDQDSTAEDAADLSSGPSAAQPAAYDQWSAGDADSEGSLDEADRSWDGGPVSRSAADDSLSEDEEALDSPASLASPASPVPATGIDDPVLGDPEPSDAMSSDPVSSDPVSSDPVVGGSAVPGGMAGLGSRAQPATAVSRRPAANSAEWSEIKALFVDDPASSVRLAVKQVELSVDGLTAAMKRAQDAAASSDQASAQLTEHLRTTLLAYQEVCAEIGRLTARLPTPQGNVSPSTSLAASP